MKLHTDEFKKQICTLGMEQNVLIEYDGITLDNENINSVSVYYQSRLLKSVMKGANIDSDVNIPIGKEIVLKYGLLVNGAYEYLTLGTFIVMSSEKQEDTGSYLLECYDRMLPFMVDYTPLEITYPITIREYIKKICEFGGLTFKNAEDTFPNSERTINKELYLDEDGNTLGYTFRDILDELAQVTGGIICIDEESGQLEIRHINETNDEINEEFLNDVNVNFGEKFGPINSVIISRADADDLFLRDEESVTTNGLCEIKIIDNQIMNWEDREDYLPDLLEALKGIEYYLNDYSSSGIVYYDVLDRYNVRIGENVYPCIMFNNELTIESGIEEIIYTERPDESKTDYNTADKTDRRILQVLILVNKQKGQIELSVKREEVIARINMALEKQYGENIPENVERSIIQFFANNLEWKADHSEMTKDGILKLKNTSNEPYVFTEADAQKATSYIRGEISLPPETIELYDIDGNGSITIMDVISILNAVTGKEEIVKYAPIELVFDPSNPSEFIKMLLAGVTKFQIGANEIYSQSFRGLSIFLGTFAGLNEIFGISLDGEQGKITITNKDASTETVIDAGMVDAYNVKASSGGGKGYCMHGTDESHTYRCNWGNESGTNFIEVYVDDAQIPLIKSVPDNAQQISQMRLQTSYIEFVVPRLWCIFYIWNCSIRHKT